MFAVLANLQDSTSTFVMSMWICHHLKQTAIYWPKTFFHVNFSGVSCGYST